MTNEELINWIRSYWDFLKKLGKLNIALSGWVVKGGYGGDLDIEDIIYIEEMFPEYLNLATKRLVTKR